MDSAVTETLRRLLSCPPAAFAARGDVEVHTLVSRDHVVLYLFAAKSLARHWPEVRPVVHDDGTLTSRDLARLRRHVPRVRVIDRAEADARIEPLLAGHPLLAAVRRNNVRILQLVDYFLLSETEIVVGMDSDIVILRRPHEIIDWVRSPSSGTAFWYSPEEGWEPAGIPWIGEHLPGVPHIRYMCCGFTCARRAEFFDAELLETWLAELPREVAFAPRFVTQMCYSLLGGRLGPHRARSLGEPYRSGRLEWLPDIGADRAICHYFASHERETAVDNLCEEQALLAGSLPPG